MVTGLEVIGGVISMCYIQYIGFKTKTIQYIVFNTSIYNIQNCLYVFNTCICYIQELIENFIPYWKSQNPDTNFRFQNLKTRIPISGFKIRKLYYKNILDKSFRSGII